MEICDLSRDNGKTSRYRLFEITRSNLDMLEAYPLKLFISNNIARLILITCLICSNYSEFEAFKSAEVSRLKDSRDVPAEGLPTEVKVRTGVVNSKMHKDDKQW